MAGLDEDALTCDFAETYHVYDWRALPARRAATLAMGLRPDSRIMQKISGEPAPVNTLLLAMIADGVRLLLWRQTKDGQKGRRPPEQMLKRFYKGRKQNEETAGFQSREEFLLWRKSMTGGNRNA